MLFLWSYFVFQVTCFGATPSKKPQEKSSASPDAWRSLAVSLRVTGGRFAADLTAQWCAAGYAASAGPGGDGPETNFRMTVASGWQSF